MAPISPTLRSRLAQRNRALQTERSSWIEHWRDLSTYLLPRSGRFIASDRNRGNKRHNAIYDNTGTRALRVLAAGLMAGMTSPARPWFRLSTGDPDLDRFHSVQTFLYDTREIMLAIFRQSNTYRAFHSLYEELGAFGTGASIMLDDFGKVVHHTPLTIGEYCLATDAFGRPDTLYREFDKTAGELIKEFGYRNCSQTVRTAYDNGNHDQWVTVIHAIEPRADRDHTMRDARNMPWRSVYWEAASEQHSVLRESGFRRFRVLAPRWHLTSGDIYGSSPGMDALGDIRQLQHEQFRKAQGIDYMTRPPLQAPTTAAAAVGDLLPGGVSFFDVADAARGVRTMFDVRLDLSHLLADIQDVRGRVNSAFFADLFLMVSQVDNSMTATEVAERHEEKLLVLGPVLERLHDEMLSPAIDMTLDRVIEAGLLPPVPPELQGREISVEFISTLAQAQRAVGAQAHDRFVGAIGALAQIGKPEALDKLDADRLVDDYADRLGVNPHLIVPGEQVALIRRERAQAAAAAQQAEIANMHADTAAKLGTTPGAGSGQPTALQDVMGLFAGYNSLGAETY